MIGFPGAILPIVVPSPLRGLNAGSGVIQSPYFSLRYLSYCAGIFSVRPAYSELRRSIEHVLANPAEQRAARRSYADRIMGVRDGKVGERIADYLLGSG